MLRATQFSGSEFHFARTDLYPIAPVRPPAAAVLVRTLQPTLRRNCSGSGGPKTSLRIIGWVDQTLNVPAVGQNKSAARAVEPGGVVAALPRRDVVGQAGDDVTIQVHLRHVERRAAHHKLAGVDERISLDQIEEVGMKLRWQARRVVVPIQNV